MFEKMHHHLYKTATKSSVSTRKQYHLGDIEDTGGGLSDPDRVLLTSLSIFEFGLGESTHIRVRDTGVLRYSGVDSDAVWVGNARDPT